MACKTPSSSSSSFRNHPNKSLGLLSQCNFAISSGTTQLFYLSISLSWKFHRFLLSFSHLYHCWTLNVIFQLFPSMRHSRVDSFSTPLFHPQHEWTGIKTKRARDRSDEEKTVKMNRRKSVWLRMSTTKWFLLTRGAKVFILASLYVFFLSTFMALLFEALERLSASKKSVKFNHTITTTWTLSFCWRIFQFTHFSPPLNCSSSSKLQKGSL